MPTTQVLIHLPDELVRRFKRHISVRQRSKFVQWLLEDALPPEDGSDDDPIYQAALAVEKEQELASEMAEWEAATIEDGFSEGKDAGR
jgi:metal-responsive CopG/Arc/MetJ family transcriptional regulator